MRIPSFRIPAAAVAGVVVSAVVARSAWAQQPTRPAGSDAAGICARPDSITVRGVSRVAESAALGDVGLAPGTELSAPQLQGAIRRLYATGQYEDVRVTCEPSGTAARIVFTVRERPLLAEVTVTGPKLLSSGSVRDKIELLVGQPVDPAKVARAVERVDSAYQAKGYYLARIKPETTTVAEGRVRLQFRIDEGRRLAISGIRVNGNQRLSDEEVVGAMTTKPEGFWWWRKGAFDEEKFAGDLSEKIPALYAQRGFIDFQVVKDTLIVDRERGKAFIDLTVSEGPQYRLGTFEIVDNHRFNTEELARYYPFTGEGPTLTQRALGIVRGSKTEKGVFDQSQWQSATEKVQGVYGNQGYIYARVEPVVQRAVNSDSQPVVNLRWQIDERTPAIIRRIDIAGNDYTSEECIRRQIVIAPGGVYNRDGLLRSWQSIGNLGFFESPLPFPEQQTANDNGDLDITFRVKEKRTGSVNFGASMGGTGVGVGGFIGLDQPNLFGLCKRGSLNWNFGRFVNDFNLTYSDPAVRKSRVSGSVSAYRSQSRYNISGFGQNTRTGINTRVGLPVPGFYYSTLGVSYGVEATTFRDVQSGVFIGQCTANCLRSSLGVDFTHDTRVDMPFASEGGLQSIQADFIGGPLGGTVSYQRYTGDFRAYTPIFQFGGGQPGAQAKKILIGLSAKGGAVFGDPGPFFQYQSFALGGVQFGQQLRGYPEFSITPRGFDPTSDNFNAGSGRQAFGNAYFTFTAEVGLRLNSQLYIDAFYDAGNNFDRPREFNPTRLFRGAGIGGNIVTPLGPLGLDWAYGFDRTSFDPITGKLRPDPKWQLHFRLGQLF